MGGRKEGRREGKKERKRAVDTYGTYGTYTKTRSVHKMVRARMQLRALLIIIWPASQSLLQRRRRDYVGWRSKLASHESEKGPLFAELMTRLTD